MRFWVGIAVVILDVAAGMFGLIAAWYWYHSSLVVYPRKLHGVVPMGGSATIDTRDLLKAVEASSGLNRTAARFTAAAVFCGAAGNLLGIWPF